MRRVTVFSLAVVGLAALGGCESDGGIAGPNRGSPFVFGGPAASLADTALVGAWSLTVTSIDETGAARSVETAWTFNSDGSARRTTTTRDAIGGIIDRQEALARWTADATQVVLDFTVPFSQRVTLPFVRQGESLVLGGQTFVRRF
jgi:hypothetical protein